MQTVIDRVIEFLLWVAVFATVVLLMVAFLFDLVVGYMLNINATNHVLTLLEKVLSANGVEFEESDDAY